MQEILSSKRAGGRRWPASAILTGWVLVLFMRAAMAAGPAVAEPDAAAEADDAVVPLHEGDRICPIGNTLAERMQYFGYFETLLQQRFPDRELSLRNLAWPADEIFLRPREENFGSLDDYLRQQKADVVLAFFGLNESYRLDEGKEFAIDEAAWRDFLREMEQARYNGASPVRLVLISPIAAEQVAGLPEGWASERNRQLEQYTAVMRRAAGAVGIRFVDLFTPTRRLFAETEQDLTLNGIHLSEAGYRKLAPILIRELFGEGDDDEPRFDERLRREIVDRNEVFFDAYRPVNGAYIYGRRSQLRHRPDKSWTNADEMEREREIFRRMADQHDRRIQALARGEEVPDDIEYNDLPSLFEIETNYPAEIEYLYGEEALASFELAEGYRIERFASEQTFPELANPVAIRFDGGGRLWALTMPLFPQRRPDQALQGRLLIFEDEDRDGQADTMTVFADGLHVPTGFELGDGGAYVANQQNLLFLRDTTGDGRADDRRRILHGFGTADSHHANSALVWGPEGALYLAEGVFLRSQVETPYGPRRLRDGGVWRYVPQRHELEVFAEYVFPNPWGHLFDRWGRNIIMDATGPDAYYGGTLSVRSDQEPRHGDGPGAETSDWVEERAPHFDVGLRPNAGLELISSRHFPEESQGNLLLSNVVGFQGIREYALTDDGPGLAVEPFRDLVVSKDPNFRPIDMTFGPEGALYFCDWHSRLIGHMTHSLRDPNRDQSHGRIYRVVREDQALPDPVHVKGRSPAELLALLDSPGDRTLYRARRELRRHDDEAVLGAVQAWGDQLDPNHPEYERLLLEALWQYQARGAVDRPLLERLLRAEDFRVRAAATRVLRHWVDKFDRPDALLKEQVTDSHPRVRLEAVAAASFLDDRHRALELVALAQQDESDEDLAYVLEEARHLLEEDEK